LRFSATRLERLTEPRLACPAVLLRGPLAAKRRGPVRSSQLAIVKEKKTEVINRFKTHAKDTGSAPVQVAVLTEQINQLNEHFKTHKKDFHSRRGMLMLIGRRRRLLDYLQKQDPKKYEETINKLDLRK
jgi:small subunit ribosomal protein S15